MDERANSLSPLKRLERIAVWLFLAGCLALTLHIHRKFLPIRTDLEGQEQDIFYSYLEGKRILLGLNPYERILGGNMRVNEKYAAYFPGFYLLSAWTQRIGFAAYEDWARLWRWVFMFCQLGVGALLFFHIRRRSLILAMFAAAFWLFNRWSLHVGAIAHLDPLPLFFLVLSLCLLQRRLWLACLAFSVSLGLKQIALFMAPLYVIKALAGAEGKQAAKRAALACALVAAVPLALSIPFLIWGAEGYLKSILFSVTREPASSFGNVAVDYWLGLRGVAGRAPMFALLAAAYWLYWRRVVNFCAASALVMFAFVDFNTVLFIQYMVWVIPLVPLTIAECAPDGRGAGQAPAS